MVLNRSQDGLNPTFGLCLSSGVPDGALLYYSYGFFPNQSFRWILRKFLLSCFESFRIINGGRRLNFLGKTYMGKNRTISQTSGLQFAESRSEICPESFETTGWSGSAHIGGPVVSNDVLKRVADLTVGLAALAIAIIPMFIIALVVKLTSKGPVLHYSDRIGKNNTLFSMPKFRTMKVGTPMVASHLLSDPDRYLTTIGKFLRKTSLDELPQLLSIIRGDMTLVGPRPALFNQDDLIELRTRNGVHVLTPGLTGWAQINGRDELPIPVKVEYDKYYLNNQSLLLDLKIFWRTFFRVVKADGIGH